MKPSTRVLCIAVVGLTACKFPYPPDVNDDGRLADAGKVDGPLGDGAEPVAPTIAFTSDRTGDNEVYIGLTDGSMPVNLTNNLASDFHPLWSPNGDRIAFLSDRAASNSYTSCVRTGPV